MAMPLPPIPVSRAGRYWAATRPYSFTAAAVPVLLGTLTALYVARPLRFDLLAFVLTLVGAVAIQAVANVVNDLYDARTGIDRADNYGALNALVRGVVSEGEARRIILGASAVSLLIAVWFLARVGVAGLALIVVGGLLAFFYTAPPVQLKHRALGDVAVAFGFGLGILYGAFLAQTGAWFGISDWPVGQILVYGLPSLLLVVGILHANNHRDRAADRAVGARTLANVLSLTGSRLVLRGLLLAPYAIVVLAVILHVAAPFFLLPLLSLPVALGLDRRARRDDVEGMYVPEFAKLHGMFGVLAAVGLGLALWRG